MATEEFYKKLSYEDYLRRDPYVIPVRKEYLLKEIGSNKKVLDLACFDGKISELIKDNGNIVYGLDINESFLAIASSRGINTKVHNLENPLPFENNFFDVVHCGEIIEHIFDTKKLLVECNRVLCKNGLLFISTPNLNSLKNRMNVLLGRYIFGVGTALEENFGDHIRIFNNATLKKLLSVTGFKTCSTVGIPLFSRFSWFKRRFPSFSDILLLKAKKVKNVV